MSVALGVAGLLYVLVGTELARPVPPQSGPLEQCFSTFVRPRPGKFIFHKTRPCPIKFTRKYLSIFLSSYIKLTLELIIKYGIIIKSISTFMHTVWHVDKYKITFKLVINHWTNEIL